MRTMHHPLATTTRPCLTKDGVLEEPSASIAARRSLNSRRYRGYCLLAQRILFGSRRTSLRRLPNTPGIAPAA